MLYCKHNTFASDSDGPFFLTTEFTEFYTEFTEYFVPSLCSFVVIRKLIKTGQH